MLFNCPLCEGKFLSQLHLESHLDVIHCPRFSHRCQTCHRRFSVPELLAQHQREDHASSSDFEDQKPDLSTISVPPASEVSERRAESFKSEQESSDRSLEAEITQDAMDVSSVTSDQPIGEENSLENAPMVVENDERNEILGAHADVSDKEESVQLDHDEPVINSANMQEQRPETPGSSSSPKSPKVQCDLCEKQYANSDSLRRHMTDIHKPDEENESHFQCNICDFKTRLKSTLCLHLNKLHDVKPFHCDQCGMNFGQKYRLTAHKKSHGGSPDIGSPHHRSKDNAAKPKIRKQKSGKCTQSFKETLEEHISSSHNAEPKANRTFKCDSCSKTYTYKLILERHRILHHGVYPESATSGHFNCPACDFKSSTQTVLKAHAKAEHGHVIGLNRCDRCPAKFVDKRSFDSHILKHAGRKSAKCPHCDHLDWTKREVNMHIRKVHDGADKVQCTVCGKELNTVSLPTHMDAKHSNKKPYKCDQCTYATANYPNLLRHRLAVHERVQNKKCDHCAFATYQKANLEKHIRTHHNELVTHSDPTN